MSNTYSESILIKGKPFIFNVIGINKLTVDQFKNRFDIEDRVNEEGQYVFNNTSTDDNELVSQEDMQKQFEILQGIIDDPDFGKKLIDRMPKKQNMTFRKRAVLYPYSLPWGELWEDSYCYAYPGLKAKAITDTDIEVFFEYDKQGW